MPLSLALALFFVSGATALVYEILWLRQLTLVFGTTVHATSAILSTFMGGLALGAFLGGRWMAGREVAPLRVYGFLEIGIGLLAAAVPSLLVGLEPLYRLAWRAGGSESFTALSLVKFAGIVAVLLPPTLLMGASLPVLARRVADDPRSVGGKVGTLYAVNTFGAVVGTFLAGFALIPALGVTRTLWATVAVNLTVGVAALTAPGAGATVRVDETGRTPRAAPSEDPGSRTVLLLVIAGSGFVAMALEVAWTRALALVMGSSVYAFALMLLAFLLGLAGGGGALAAWIRRHPPVSPRGLLAGLLLAAGLLASVSAVLLPRLPRLAAEIYLAVDPSPTVWLATQLGLGLLVMFPATFAFGGIFPVVLQAFSRGLERVPGEVGAVYASNTAGTILGASVTGFLLVPAIGVRDVVLAVSAIEIALAVVVVLSVRRTSPVLRGAVVGSAVAAGVVIALSAPRWDPLVMNSGVYLYIDDLPDGAGWEEFIGAARDDRLLFAREGLTASVIVAEEPEFDNLYLAVNGKVDASTQGDLETQIMAAHLPLLLSPEPARDVLVVGLASGITAGSVATHPVDSIRVVEVEEAMLEVARLFGKANGDVLDDPRVSVSVNDARNELDFNPSTYDVIVSQPSNPWMTVAANLFTKDFFMAAVEHLRPRGVFCQWVQTYNLPPNDLRSIVAGFRSALPHVLVFETFDGVDLLLLGSREPLSLDPATIERRMNELRARLDLARVGIRKPLHVVALIRLDDAAVEAWAGGAPPNTDDNARVEFSAPLALHRATLDENRESLDAVPFDPTRVLDPSPLTRLDLARAFLWLGRGPRAVAVARPLLGGPYGHEAAKVIESASKP